MVKFHSNYTCQQCGYISPQYLGKCPECSAWNSFIESVESTPVAGSKLRGKHSGTKPILLSDIKSNPKERISTGISELDYILGGGIVSGQVILLAGEPGVGKSTLLLQVMREMAKSLTGSKHYLYTSGEESAEQISLRGRRLEVGKKESNVIRLQAETNIESIISELSSDTAFLIVDSIQTMWTEDLTGAPGSVGQVRETAYRLIQHVKSKRIPLIIVGQVTKEGSIAGPKVLEHLVDTVLYMEGMKYEETRLLRVTKNRFGPTDEIAVFRMQENGLVEVSNPSANFLTERTQEASGQTIVVTIEGTRPLLVEIQALVVPSELAIPRRVATGIQQARLSIICAILSKHLRLPLGKYDVFVNVSGGYSIHEPAADLGVALAIYSSFRNIPLPPRSVSIGELSLLGEIQIVSNHARRVKEAKKLGYSVIFDHTKSTNLLSLVKRL
jgi:DNA repair protein RadA/Sms